MKNAVLAATLAVLAVAANAESTTVGKVTGVQGSVTVSSDGSVVKAVQGTPVTANSTIVVASGSKATVALANGCVINVGANQHLALNSKLTCAQQTASITQLFTPYRVAQAPVGGAATVGGGTAAAGGGLTALAIAGGIVVVGAVALNEVSTSGS